jgi:hypothetical protein
MPHSRFDGRTLKPPSFVAGRPVAPTVKIDFAPSGILWMLDMPASYAVRIDVNGPNSGAKT